ncbi:MAG: ATPase, T2SS/T4P/T4SS family [Candidatus Omnitrophota bacterium]
MAKSELRKKLQEILIESRLIAQDALDSAVQTQRQRGGTLSKILVEQGSVSEHQLMVVLGEQLGLPPINLSKVKIDPQTIKLIPEHIARYYQVIAISKMGETITVVMADPLNIFALDDIKVLTGKNVRAILATPTEIMKAIETYYAPEQEKMSEVIAADEAEDLKIIREKEEIDIGELAKSIKEAPVVKMVNLILIEAIKRRASDIHIEPYEDKLRVRYRIDGVLQEVFSPPKKIQNAILARVKIMSKLNITQRRLPQDGRFKIRFESKEIDFRVSVLPIQFGEKIVLRALDKSSLQTGLDKAGFLPQPLKVLQEAISKPFGLILVTGPTGSGKSTTLYSVINQLNSPERNIITVEDPVEYQVEGITQIHVKPEIGLTFAAALRSLLRQSPDVVMVGEIRDYETADTAIKASLTGQLILSTLHTNDAAGAITRLLDMGIEPFLIASSLVVAAAQRLCRKICESCKEPVNIPQSVFDRLEIKGDAEKITFYRGIGCGRCNKTGYYGRIGTLETLPITDEIKRMILKKFSSDQIKEYAVKEGLMTTLRDNAFEKAKNGLTTLEEVIRITAE